MWDYQTLYLDTNKSKGTVFIAVLHFTVTVGPSIMEHNSYPKMSVKLPLAYSWAVLLTAFDKSYIRIS